MLKLHKQQKSLRQILNFTWDLGISPVKFLVSSHLQLFRLLLGIMLEWTYGGVHVSQAVAHTTKSKMGLMQKANVSDACQMSLC